MFEIGLSGLDAAQKALDVIGNNLANAATEGYHRQRIELTTAYSSQTGPVLLGGGVEIAGITRMIDNLLEKEILRQQSSLEAVYQEFITMRTVENAFGELSTGNSLSATIDEFFNAMRDLSAHPREVIWQNQAVNAAGAMAGRFRTLGEFLTTLEDQIRLEAERTMDQINALINQIAELNDKIERMEVGGSQANNLRDKRDQYIMELSGFIGVETLSREYGVIDVTAVGIPIVIGASATELEVGLNESNKLGITVAGAYSYNANVQGGRLGGLLSLKNELVADVHDDLDDLASAIIQQINQYHVQGVGSEGSFTGLAGWVMASEDLADFVPPVTDGKIYIRVTNTSTGEITRNEIDIDTSTDSLTSIATDITAITGLTASVSSSKLSISADVNYKFDFLPGILSEPTTSNLTPEVSISGIYTGSANQTYTCTVVGNGDVGVASSLQIEVKIGAVVVKTVNVGSGYAAGDRLDIGDGILISIGTGTLNDTEEFTIEALASSDTSGVLAAVGINTFFYGSSASDIAVCSDIAATPGRVATALGVDMTDNTNALRLAGLRDQAVSSLNAMTPGEFYHRLITDIGQQLSVKQMRQDNIEVMVQNLANQQSEMSGVDINDEAARLLIFEQMFQAMAKYMSTVQSTVEALMAAM
ncbi:MAG: flagellar hook-associated protein FlgK [Planctomycetota bacterium]|jgi:flagellar hook-associated protein FlgK